MGAIPLLVLAAMGLINLGRGAIHAFSPDGGAHSIAGLELGDSAPTILSLFATIGLTQMASGFFQLLIAARYRSLVPLFLGMQIVTTALAMVNLYLWRPLPVTVPGQPFNLVLLAIQIAALAIALRPRTATPAAG